VSLTRAVCCVEPKRCLALEQEQCVVAHQVVENKILCSNHNVLILSTSKASRLNRHSVFALGQQQCVVAGENNVLLMNESKVLVLNKNNVLFFEQ